MRRALGLVCAAAVVLSQGSAASAATITPTTFADQFGTDQGSCALREAVQAANTDAAFGGCPGGSGADSIPLAAGTYSLTIPPDATPNDNADGDLDVVGTSTVDITHSGIAPTAISGGGVDRILNLLAGAKATVSGLTIRDGSSANPGGGIQNDAGTLVLTASTLNANSTLSNGGAIGNLNGGTAVLTNVTISGNRTSAAGTGGGIRNAGSSTLLLTDGTITRNTAADGGGIDSGGVINLSNTIIAGNTDSAAMPTLAPDCRAATPITSLGFNLIGDTSGCGYVAASSDVVDRNPQLGPLADNGGPTFTHALLAVSPAIGKGGEGSADTDQRGVPRFVPDIGAYDFANCGGRVVNRVGTEGDDTLIGTDGPDGILALAGNDVLVGLKRKDGLCGGDGNDRLFGGRGGDLLLGQRGRDRLRGGRGRDICKGGPGRDRAKGC